MFKAVTLFLVVIAVLAMFGKLGWLGPADPRRVTALKPRACPRCGRYRIGKSECGCKTKG